MDYLPGLALYLIFHPLRFEKAFSQYLYISQRIQPTILKILYELEFNGDENYYYLSLDSQVKMYLRIKTITFGKAHDISEVIVKSIPAIRNLIFLPNCNNITRILTNPSFEKDSLKRLVISNPGIELDFDESVIGLNLKNLKELELINLQKHNVDIVNKLLSYTLILASLTSLKLNNFKLDGTYILPNSLLLTHLELELTGIQFNFSSINLYMPNLYSLNIRFLVDPIDIICLGFLNSYNFPKLKVLSLRNLHVLTKAIYNLYLDKVNNFIAFERDSWPNIEFLIIDQLSLVSFNDPFKTFPNLKKLDLILKDMRFQLKSNNLNTLSSPTFYNLKISASNLSLLSLSIMLPLFLNLRQLTLSLEDFNFEHLHPLQNLLFLTDLTLMVIPRKDNSYPYSHWPLEEMSSPNRKSLLKRLYGNYAKHPDYFTITKEQGSDSVLNLRPKNREILFKSLRILRVHEPNRLFSNIIWFLEHSNDVEYLVVKGEPPKLLKRFLNEYFGTLEVIEVLADVG